MPVTREDVAHIAQLARLALDEPRVPELTRQLNEILQHFEALSDVDTGGMEAAAGVGDAAMPLRADRGEQIPLLHPRDAFAPAMRDGFFIVPRLATHEDETAAVAGDDAEVLP